MIRFPPMTVIACLIVAALLGGCGAAQTVTTASSCGHLYTLFVGKRSIPLGDCAGGVGPPYALNAHIGERFSVRVTGNSNDSFAGPLLAVEGDSVAAIAQSDGTVTYDVRRVGTSKLVDRHPYCEHTRKPTTCVAIVAHVP